MQNRVLLIEDDDELRELLARYLASQGFSVREAANGRDGLALALGQDCDIVVLDIMLPDINGGIGLQAGNYIVDKLVKLTPGGLCHLAIRVWVLLVYVVGRWKALGGHVHP